ncbi:addiction module protein [Thiorhodovibrio winogradskyi]|uniref:addiction module protein n=1 Tax=Thiorhodovibrio winogradskyi TaxID=77007 RepID=UPI0038B69DA6
MKSAAIRKMSVSERIRTMEAIWDSLLYDVAEMPSPEWHRNILEERKRKMDEGSARFLSIQEVKERQK